MDLTSEMREQVRLSILRHCLARTRSGLIRANLRGEGYKLDEATIALEVQYLCDKNLLKVENKIVSPENQFFRTTAEGRDYLATQGEEKA